MFAFHDLSLETHGGFKLQFPKETLICIASLLLGKLELALAASGFFNAFLTQIFYPDIKMYHFKGNINH